MSHRIEHVPLGSLMEDEANPKAHALATLDASIGRYGFIEPLVLDGRTGKVISGHGRRKTLAKMEARGDSPPAGVSLDEAGRWLVPVVTGWSSRSDTEAHAALITLNRVTELGGWVDESLLALLDELGEVEDGYAGVGFDEAETDALRARIAEMDGEEPPEPDDETPSDRLPGTSVRADMVVIRLPVDSPIAHAWEDHRDEHDSDVDALGVLLGVL